MERKKRELNEKTRRSKLEESLSLGPLGVRQRDMHTVRVANRSSGTIIQVESLTTTCNNATLQKSLVSSRSIVSSVIPFPKDFAGE